MDTGKRFKHICEVCGKEQMLTADEAHKNGWDYPPHIGMFGVVSPRTCPDCSMMDTAWFAISCQGKSIAELTEKQLETIKRIQEESQGGEV